MVHRRPLRLVVNCRQFRIQTNRILLVDPQKRENWTLYRKAEMRIVLFFAAISVTVESFLHRMPLSYRQLPRLPLNTVIRDAAQPSSEEGGSNSDFKNDLEFNVTSVLEDSRSGPSRAFQGAGRPRPNLRPEDLPPLLMEALAWNDFPNENDGIRSVWAFAGDTTRHIFNQNQTEFIESVHETANTLPTSFYGVAMYGKNWTMESPINHVGGSKDGWIATQVMKTYSSDDRMRRWQWELRKNRRPPNLGCWFVESIGSSDRKGEFEVE
eukprot:scaffold3515_cov126-Cylindrotheca_fusiformis.AAC.10